jgi:alpha-galactosidase
LKHSTNKWLGGLAAASAIGIATATAASKPGVIPQPSLSRPEDKAPGQSGKIKVFILAGQSNMEGHTQVETFDYVGDDPTTVPLLQQMRGVNGKPRVCDKAWISYFTGAGEQNYELTGKLTAGFGSLYGTDSKKPGDKIGPEFTFGLTMDAALAEPVLIIKAAWGGKSLHTDFRPPSAGPYVFSETQLANLQKRGKDVAEARAKKAAETGVYYRLVLEHVKQVLADPKRVCPAYDEKQGYEVAGFVWLQGWNDLVDGDVYPERHKPGGYAAYSQVMAQFIRDVRKDLNAPKMPFIIGVLGVGGEKTNPQTLEFRKAMAAPAALPEFQAHVAAVETAPFCSEELAAIDDKREKVRQMRYFLDSKHKDHANAEGKMTEEQKREFIKKFEADLITPAEAALWKRGASNAGYHYLGCAKTIALMGRAFAEANLRMLESQRR